MELDAENKQVKYAQKRLRMKMKKQQEKDKKIFGGMFGKISLVDEEAVATKKAKTEAEAEVEEATVDEGAGKDDKQEE